MHTATRPIGTFVAPAWALCLLLLPACATQEKAPEGSSLNAVRMVTSPDLASAVGDYREARYDQSFERSKTLARTSSSPLREQAAWVAGLSAYQLNRLDEAELQFMSSGRSEDKRLVVDSKIMMGDVRVLQNRWSDAAQHYRDAANGLAGEERSRVLGYAEVATSHAATRAAGQAGASPSAGSPWSGTNAGTASSAGAGSSSAGWSTAPSRATSSGATAASAVFALQAGAFQNEANARRRATEIAGSARQAGLGEPRVVRTRDSSGREFWAVQVGSFATRQSADEARARAGSINFIVAGAS